jgi:hypothetical protein
MNRDSAKPASFTWTMSKVNRSCLESRACQHFANLVEDGGIIDRGRHLPASPSAIFCMVARRILPDRVLGSRLTAITFLNAATGPILSRTSLTTSFSTSSGAVDARIDHDEARRDLALHAVGNADDRAFSHVRMRRAPSSMPPVDKTVAGDIDDVVGARHDEQIAVLIDEAGVRSLVVAGELRR